MSALIEISAYLIKTVTSFYVGLILIRFLLQVAKADFYNPISQFVVKATNPGLLPLRKIIPGLWGLDLASLLLAVIVQMLAIHAILMLVGYGFGHPANTFIWSLIAVVATATKFLFFSIIISIVFSWLAPSSSHPALALLHQINEPILGPVRRMLPAMGGLDFSPILVFILLNIIDILIRNAAAAAGMFSGLTMII
ncbi:MAG: YggT family protein [Chitinophagales bacterium]|jgi:YggT family protein